MTAAFLRVNAETGFEYSRERSAENALTALGKIQAVRGDLDKEMERDPRPGKSPRWERLYETDDHMMTAEIHQKRVVELLYQNEPHSRLQHHQDKAIDATSQAFRMTPGGISQSTVSTAAGLASPTPAGHRPAGSGDHGSSATPAAPARTERWLTPPSNRPGRSAG
ncbi:hypothetical protein GCM10012279_33180 [Micromonospora yangpuensis]|nr:hypothetical protein GCM10012279_33180 [Micromonospora yangpuensis]